MQRWAGSHPGPPGHTGRCPALGAGRKGPWDGDGHRAQDMPGACLRGLGDGKEEGHRGAFLPAAFISP